MYFGATNWVQINDPTATFVQINSANLTRHPGCVPVIYSVTLRVTNGATAGPNGILIADDAGTTILDIYTDFVAGGTDTIHMTWPGGLPLYRPSSTSAGGSGGTGANYYEDKARDAVGTSLFRIVPQVTDTGDVTFCGLIAYGFVPASMIK